MNPKIINEINRWIKDNPQHCFQDKNNIDVNLLYAKDDIMFYKTPIHDVISKPIRAISINGMKLTSTNAYKILSQSNQLDNIMESYVFAFTHYFNNWAEKNKDKWFNQHFEPFKVIGAKVGDKDAYTPLIIIENSESIRRELPIYRFTVNGKRLNTETAIEQFDKTQWFDTAFSFAEKSSRDEVEQWFKNNRKIIQDKNEETFYITGIQKNENSGGLSFVIEDKDGTTFTRPINAIKVNGKPVCSATLMNFLHNAEKIDSQIFASANKQYSRMTRNHYMPDIADIKTGMCLRLRNGQCAKVIEVHNKQNICGVITTFDLLVEDGTIIKGLSSKKLENGLWRANKNAPILNSNKNKVCTHDEIAKIAQKHFLKIAPQRIGHSSVTEQAYMNYLKQIGFQTADMSFLERYFGNYGRRYPDGFMLRDGKMVIFEYDGYAGHGNIISDKRNNIQKDYSKNEMYQELINNAKAGTFLPEISDVVVLRVRGQGVPLLNPSDIVEIVEDKSKDFYKSIENTIFEMTKTIDKLLHLNTTREMENAILQSTITVQVPQHIGEFEISRMIGYGTKEDRCGQFAAIQKPKHKSKQLLPNSEVEVLFETGEKTIAKYQDFLDGTVLNRNAIRLYDFNKNGENLKAIKCRGIFANIPALLYDEIVETRKSLPVIDGVITQKQTPQSILVNYLNGNQNQSFNESLIAETNQNIANTISTVDQVDREK